MITRTEFHENAEKLLKHYDDLVEKYDKELHDAYRVDHSYTVYAVNALDKLKHNAIGDLSMAQLMIKKVFGCLPNYPNWPAAPKPMTEQELKEHNAVMAEFSKPD